MAHHSCSAEIDFSKSIGFTSVRPEEKMYIMQSFFSIAATFLCICTLPVSAADDDHWDTQFGAPGADGLVTSMTSSGSDLYITGNFNSAGEAGCIGIAKWNGTNWTGFGSGFAIGSVPVGLGVAVHGTDVYVAGGFITNISGVPIRGLGKWDGSSWSQVGGGMNGIPASLLFKSNDLYVGGIFTQAGSVTASNIVRWDGANWWPLGTGIYGATNGFSGSVALKMALDANGDLIVCGNFRYAGGVEVNNVARWDGNQWHALGSGVFGGGSGQTVNDVKVLGTNIYVAGVFKSASGVNATNLARWDGTQWYAMGGGPSGTNSALAIIGTNIYTAGNFTNIGGVAARYVARWNGQAWQALAPGLTGGTLTRISCLGAVGDILYAGGDFIQAGNAGTLAIAKWDGIQWSGVTGPKSQGLWLSPSTVAVVGSDVYVGGSGLLIAGGLKPNKIAHWNGTSWDDMGGGVTGGGADINAIVPFGGNIYAGGNFTNAGGVAARNIAYWDGSGWHAMASGLDSNVNALVVYNGEIYAGGAFRLRGNGSGGFLFGVSRWDGSDWQSLGIFAGRTDNSINSLATDGTSLYVGGNFLLGWLSDSGTNIARWDGGSWYNVGTGIRPTVNALAIMGSDLFAGGSFTSASGITARRIARWDGFSWSEVGGGLTNGTVSALAVSGSTLYVGGSFTNAGGTTSLHRFVKWDGTQWYGFGSGISRISPSSSSVSEIAIAGDDVYAVGSFTYAGGRPSAAIAHWNETISFVPPVIRLLNVGLDGLGQFRFDISGLSSGTYTVDATTNLTDWSAIFSDSVPNTNFTDVDSLNIPSRVYRVRTP